MNIGHISVGRVGTTRREYILHPDATGGRVRSLVNPMAAKISQGAVEYQDEENWDYFSQDNWQGGIGRIRPGEDGGYLYGDVDSRVPNQLILPPLLHMADRRDLDETIADCRYMPENASGTLGAGTYAMKFTTPAAFVGTVVMLRLYASLQGQTITAAPYTNVADAPGSIVTTAVTITDNGNAGGQYAWYGESMAHSVFSTATSYWLVFTVPEGATVVYGSSSYARAAMQNTGSWVTLTDKYILFQVDCHNILGTATVEYPGGVFRLGSTLYSFLENDIYKYVPANENWTSVGSAGTGNITGAVVLGTSVYLSKSAGDYYTMNTSETIAASSGGEDAHLLHGWKESGLLWRSFDNYVYYTNDGVTWSAAIEVCSSAYAVRGMAGMGDYLFCATDDGLYRIYADVAFQVTRWGTTDSENGRNMVHHNGSLYIPVNNRIFEYTEAGSLRDIWTQPEHLPLRRAGVIHSLYSTNNWLLALTGNTDNPSIPLVWAFQSEGWHPLMLPPEMNATAFSSYNRTSNVLYYDRTLNRLWLIDGRGVTWWVIVPDYALNPYFDSSYRFMPFAWIEWDWLDAPIRERSKDIESITIIGENLSTYRYIKAYWQDDDSAFDSILTTEGGEAITTEDGFELGFFAAYWQLLGTFDNINETIRWNDYTTRPRTKRIKLALQLATNDASDTPRVQAMVLRYQTHLRDRYRWQFTILCSEDQKMMNNELNDFTRAQMETHLQLLEGTDANDEQTAPFILEDVTGELFEVKVVTASHSITNFEYINGAKRYDAMFRWTVDQATQGQYVP